MTVSIYFFFLCHPSFPIFRTLPTILCFHLFNFFTPPLCLIIVIFFLLQKHPTEEELELAEVAAFRQAAAKDEGKEESSKIDEKGKKKGKEDAKKEEPKQSVKIWQLWKYAGRKELFLVLYTPPLPSLIPPIPFLPLPLPPPSFSY